MDAAAPNDLTPEHPHGVSVPTPQHYVNYVLIFFALAGLTILTVLIATERFSNELANVALALLLAFIKATFVARFFMHLKFEGKLIYFILLVPLSLTIVLICALVPDIAMTHPGSNSTSLHIYQNPVLNQ